MDSSIAVLIECPKCLKNYVVFATRFGVDRWLQGDYVQSAFPDLEPEEREHFISGLCRSCQSAIFSTARAMP